MFGPSLSAERLGSTEAASVAYAAQLTGSSVGSINRAKAVQRLGEESLIKAVEQGTVSVKAAERVARLPKDEQRAAVASGLAAVHAAAHKATPKKSSAPRKDTRRGDAAFERAKALMPVRGQSAFPSLIREFEIGFVLLTADEKVRYVERVIQFAKDNS